MQAITPLAAADFLSKVQEVLYKFELYIDSVWVDLCDLDGENYLIKDSLNFAPSGAGATPDVIGGTWSATIYNPEGMFHPLNSSSAYAGYFTIGRKVRISVGGSWAGTTHYWTRLTGYMDAPKFDHKARTVALSGGDYAKRLEDFGLRRPGNFWGASATFSSVATVATYGSEIYAEGDALDIASEANNMTNWVDGGGINVSTIADTGAGSTYAAVFSKPIGYTYGYSYNINVGSVTQGKEYEFSFDWAQSVGAAVLKVQLYSYADGQGAQFIEVSGLTGGYLDWTHCVLHGKATKTGTAGMLVQVDGSAAAQEGFRLDNVSIREVTSKANAGYPLPAVSNGPYFATLDGEAYWYGDDNQGWTYDESNRVFRLAADAWVEAGTNNLVVWYFTTQTLENVVADILAAGPGDSGGGAGLYANQAAALADMDYTATGITIPRVWFDAGTKADAALKMLCQRSNYRFFLDQDGKPDFNPAPVETASVFDFTSWGDLSALNDGFDLAQIRNRIVIEGAEQAMYKSRDDKQSSRWTGETSDATSIADHGEHTETIKNHLFQDQASITAMKAAMLAERKDEALFADVTVPYCALPLQVGDTITWWIDFIPMSLLDGGDFGTAPPDILDGGDFDAAPTDILDGGTFQAFGEVVTGIVRSLSQSSGTLTAHCEVMTPPVSPPPPEEEEDPDDPAVPPDPPPADPEPPEYAYWVSPTGAAAWEDAYSDAALTGADCASIATANANVQPGDVVYLRAGTYTNVNINPARSGTSDAKIYYTAYTGEVPEFNIDDVGVRWAVKFVNRSYIVVDGILAEDCLMFFYIGYGACYNEIKNSTFDRGVYGYSTGLISCLSTAGTVGLGSDHNWLHNNVFSKYGKVTSGGDDRGTIRIGSSATDPTKNTTVEDNVFYHGGHDNMDIGGQYNVVRNNVFHNEETYFEDLWGTFTNSPASGYFGNRNIIVTNYGSDGIGVAQHNLIEGNRIGHSGCPPDDDGSFGIEDAGCHTIARGNYIYATAGSGIYLKGQPAPPSILAVTGSAATNVITSGAAHGLTTGRRVKFIDRVGASGLTDGVYYWVTVIDATTFTLSLTDGGATVALVTDLASAGLVRRYLRSGSWHHGYQNTLYHCGYGDADIGSSFKYGIQAIGYWDHDYEPWPCGVAFVNNIVYDSNTGEYVFPDHGELLAYTKNLTTDPSFVDADITDPTSLILPDLRLETGSAAIDGGDPLTLCAGGGTNETALVVDDARFFQDGWGSALALHEADWIAVGTVGNTVQIESIDYETNTLTLATAISWSDDDPVWWYKDSKGTVILTGTAPNQGAYQGTGE